MRRKIILVYPLQGFSGTFVKHVPLGLIYTSAEIIKEDYDVRIFDSRLYPNTWKSKLKAMIDSDTLAVGISVMSGTPIKFATEISHLVKNHDPEVKVIWGGPHVTFQQDSILAFEPNCDYALSGYGAWPFKLLIHSISNGRAPADVPGISYRAEGGEILKIPKIESFENIPYQELPYQLIDDYSIYGHLGSHETIFSMYSVLGCPYQCTFCSSPAQYRGIPGKKWIPLTVQDVVNHISFVVERYKASFIYFIDDDSFVKLDHVEGIIDEIKKRNLKVKLGFRGARINEIKKMSDAFITKLAEAGTNIMHVGVESGSNRILKLIRKDCTVDDIIACNQKLARHPEIMVGYNIMMGVPTETIQELNQTRDLILRLVDDHKNCIIFQPNKFRPLPDTELFNLAVRDWNYRQPKTLEDWSNLEVEGDYSSPWVTQEMKRFCDMMLITSYFVDRKAQKVAKGRSVIEFLIRLLDWVYGPIARFRFRRGLSGALIEYTIYELAQMVARRVGAVVGKHNVQVSQTPKTEPRSGDLIRDRCAS